MKTRLCDHEGRKLLFEQLKLSMKQHYPTIFSELDDEIIEFGLDDDGSILMRIYADNDDYDAPYVFNLWKVMARIPLGDADEWCFETFIEGMEN